MKNLDLFFDYLLSDSVKRDLKFKRNYRNYDEIINYYKKKFNECSSEKNTIYTKNISEVYVIPFDLLGGGYFELKFDINKIKTLIKSNINFSLDKDYNSDFKVNLKGNKEDIVKGIFSQRFLKEILDESTIDKTYAKNSLNKSGDIICADLSGISDKRPPFEIIDGNHRAYIKVKNNINNLDGIILSRNIWMNGLLTEEDIMFVKIYSNINYIASCRAGQFKEKEIERYLYKI